MNSVILDAMSKISNYCSDQNCEQCPLCEEDNFEHRCDLRDTSPDNWRYLIDRLRDKGE